MNYQQHFKMLEALQRIQLEVNENAPANWILLNVKNIVEQAIKDYQTMNNNNAPLDFKNHECEFFLMTDIAVHGCECGRVTVSGGASIEYVSVEIYQAEKQKSDELLEGLKKIFQTEPKQTVRGIEIQFMHLQSAFEKIQDIANDLITKYPPKDQNFKEDETNT